MTPFEKQFIIDTLDFLKTIISNPYELSEAVLNFTQNKESPSFQIDSKIYNVIVWSSDAKTRLAAAVFEAIARTTNKVCDNPELIKNPEELTKEIEAATKLFLTWLPELTSTNKSNKLIEIPEKCERLKKQLTKQSLYDNPYVFYSAVAAGIAVAAVATAYTFKNN